MTKAEILKIIEQNKDILTPENYQRVLKNVDIFTEEDKKNIAAYLIMAKEMIKVNNDFMKARNVLYKQASADLEEIDKKIIDETKETMKKEEEGERGEESDEAEDLISNL